MGTWVPGVFSDDLAADVCSGWRDASLAGGDADEATRALVDRHAGWSDGDPEQTVFWCALAAAQMETGRLRPGVRDRALMLIDAGGDLDLWEEAGGRAARQRVLERLAERLRGPQPEPKRLRGPRVPPDPGVQVGDVVRIWNRDRSRSALFAVTAIDVTSHGRWPVLLGRYWDGAEVPGAHALAALPYLSEVDLSAFDGDEPPDHMAVAFPQVMTVAVSRPADKLRPEIGEVVARGVARDEDLGDTGSLTTTSWAREQEPAPIDAAAAFWLEHLRRESLDEG